MFLDDEAYAIPPFGFPDSRICSKYDENFNLATIFPSSNVRHDYNYDDLETPYDFIQSPERSLETKSAFRPIRTIDDIQELRSKASLVTSTTDNQPTDSTNPTKTDSVDSSIIEFKPKHFFDRATTLLRPTPIYKCSVSTYHHHPEELWREQIREEMIRLEMQWNYLYSLQQMEYGMMNYGDSTFFDNDWIPDGASLQNPSVGSGMVQECSIRLEDVDETQDPNSSLSRIEQISPGKILLSIEEVN